MNVCFQDNNLEEIRRIFTSSPENLKSKGQLVKTRIECYSISKGVIESTLCGLKALETHLNENRSNINENELTLIQNFSSFLEFSIQYYFYYCKKIEYPSKTEYPNKSPENSDSLEKTTENLEKNTEENFEKKTENFGKTENFEKITEKIEKSPPKQQPTEPKYTLLNRSLAYQYVKNFEDFKLLQPNIVKNHKNGKLNGSSIMNTSKIGNISMEQEELIESVRRNQRDAESVKRELKELEEKNARLIWNEEREVLTFLLKTEFSLFYINYREKV